MTKKKERKKVAKIIRRETGLPFGACHMLARAYVKGNAFCTDNEKVRALLNYKLACGDAACCGLATWNPYITGPRGSVSFEAIAEKYRARA